MVRNVTILLVAIQLKINKLRCSIPYNIFYIYTYYNKSIQFIEQCRIEFSHPQIYYNRVRHNDKGDDG